MVRGVLHPAAMLALLALLSPSTDARAHEIRPAIADLSVDRAGGYEVSIKFNLEALLAGIGPAHTDTSEAPGAAEYERLRSLSPADLRRAFDAFAGQFLDGVMLHAGDTPLQPAVLDVQVPPVSDTGFPRRSRIVIGGTLPPGAESVTWAWDAEFGPIVLRLPGPDAGDPPLFAELLQNGVASDAIPVAGDVRRTFAEIARDYLVIGFTHILPKGLDHILFVIGLYLLSTRLSTLVWQVTRTRSRTGCSAGGPRSCSGSASSTGWALQGC
ncbi:MAG: HupE/UreJ family protein [Rhodospirillales bacterium]|nr:HupE/UreJ family protein [Rhodospirillales bacterium]